uniref:WWC1-like helical hairpin domain-containing protein n=1 Tax=Sinocyclocheilus rhinocerous TaxID=307959 RepID=A0A673FSZ2_9TELE
MFVYDNSLMLNFFLHCFIHFAAIRIANIEVQIAKLDSEAWPGLLDPERDRLILINEKEELLKELQYVTPCKRAPCEAEKIESEKKRLEKDLQAARDNQSKALTERPHLHYAKRAAQQSLCPSFTLLQAPSIITAQFGFVNLQLKWQKLNVCMQMIHNRLLVYCLWFVASLALLAGTCVLRSGCLGERTN